MYVVYLIPGKKVGGSKRVEERVKEQGYTEYKILEICNSEEELSEREIFWQEKLGYRKDPMSYSKIKEWAKKGHTEEVSERRVQTWRQTVAVSEEYKNCLLNVHKMNTPEAKAKKAAIHKKPIVQLDMQNNIIREWDSATDASKVLDFSLECIRMACKGKIKSSQGFKWKFKN